MPYGDPADHFNTDFRYGSKGETGSAAETIKLMTPGGEGDPTAQLHQLSWIRSHKSAKIAARLIARQYKWLPASALTSPMAKQLSGFSQQVRAIEYELQLVNSIGGNRTADIVQVATAGAAQDNGLRRLLPGFMRRGRRGGNGESQEFNGG
jgi:hypothetical protein